MKRGHLRLCLAVSILAPVVLGLVWAPRSSPREALGGPGWKPAAAMRRINQAFGDGGYTPAPPSSTADYEEELGNGQSLSVGTGQGAVSTTNPEGTLALGDEAGVWNITLPFARGLYLKGRNAPVRPSYPGTGTGSYYPWNVAGETVDYRFTDEVTELMRAAGASNWTSVMTTTGQSGQDFSVIGPGGSGNAYEAGIYEVAAIHALAADAGHTHAVFASHLTHGEADAAERTPTATYQADIVSFQLAAQNDVCTIIGQCGPLPLLVSQQTSTNASGYGGTVTTTAQLMAAVTSSPGHPIIFTTPKYQYSYIGDFVHLANYWPLGEKEAEAYVAWRLQGSWLPFYFIQSGVSLPAGGTTGTVTAHVPFPPIVRDTTTFPNGPHQSGRFNAWALGDGFEVRDHYWGLDVIACSFTTPVQLTVGTAIGVSAALPAFATTGTTWTFEDIDVNNNATGDYLDQSWTITVVSAPSGTFTLNGSSGSGLAGSCGPGWHGTISHPVTISSVVASNVGNVATFSFVFGQTLFTDAHLSYADTCDATYSTACGGYESGLGRFGRHHDSDPFVGISGAANYNWLAAIH